MQTVWDALRAPVLHTFGRIISFAPRLLIAVVEFALFYVLALLIKRLVRYLLNRFTKVPWAVSVLLQRAALFATIFIGFLVALTAVHIEVTTLLDGLGIAGLALGFAFKDSLENFISGIMLLAGRPFELGHQVTLGEFEGTVTDIQIRTTTLTTFSNEIVVIPNSRAYTNPVINHTVLGARMYSVTFETSLQVDSDLVGREAIKAAAESQDVAEAPAPTVRIRSVGAAEDMIIWQLFYWADARKATEVATTSAVLTCIKQHLYDAGVPTPMAKSATVLIHPQNGATAPEMPDPPAPSH